MTILRCLGVLLATVSGLFWGTAQAAIITNGDFENTTGWTAGSGVPLGWSVGSSPLPVAVPQSGTPAIGGSGTSAYLPRLEDSTVIKNLSQSISDTGPLWQFDMDFASEDPRGGRTLNVCLTAWSGQYQQKTINLRVVTGASSTDERGSIEVYDSRSGWSSPTDLANCVWIDDDVTINPLVHHLRIVGNYLEATPSYTITLTDPAGSVFSETHSYYYNAPPSVGDGLEGIVFYAYNKYSTGSYDYLIDNVTVTSLPEPATLALLGSAAAVLIVWQRRRFRISD